MDKKVNVLWVSLMAPYDKVKHAGGKIENYFLKHLHAEGNFNIHLITFATNEISSDIDLDQYGISNKIYYYTWNGIQGVAMKALNAYGKLNIMSKGAGLTSPYYTEMAYKEMKRLSRDGYIPEIIIFQWTEMATMLEKAKRLFPMAKVVMIEEDVSFLGHMRKAKAASGLKAFFLHAKSKRIRKREIELLNKADMIILNNHKDERLIQKDIRNSRKIWVWCPYYQSMIDKPRLKHNKNILFYGALSREENWKTVIWFLKNVWPHIHDPEAKYVIVGSNPPNILKQYENARVIITGFVDDIVPYFQSALCLAAPLVLGAGVKIKVLEGLSSGIPVLTNNIGIEGIPAKDKVEYYHCETAEDYITVINELLNENINFDSIEKSSKDFMRRTFNFENDTVIFSEKLKKLAGYSDNK